MDQMNDVTILPEPPLEFRYGQAVEDPHDGLSLFGPVDADSSQHPQSVSYCVIGTPAGLEHFRAFSAEFRRPQYPEPGKSTALWPVFPGFEAAFACEWPAGPTRAFEIDANLLDSESRDLDANKRAAAVVDRYLAEISRLVQRDDRIDLVICIVPDTVYARCRPLSRIPTQLATGHGVSGKTRREREAGQRDLWNSYDPKIYQYSVDFRRQIKARCMQFGIPIQIVRESTLLTDSAAASSRRGLTPLSDRIWNLSVAIYYKAGGKPWRLSTTREGVCYIGLAYRRKDPTSMRPEAACAAQMFLDSGDGIVFMGRFGPWYSARRGSFHLSKSAARELLAGTLKTYEELEGPPLREIFLHCRSGIGREEFDGFAEACPPGVKLTGIRVQRDRAQVRLLREGTRPVLRGTFWKLNDRTGLLWASGYKPRLATYDGWETPAPLRIDVQHGNADIMQVATDILGLTKLNYNACRLGEGEPVTVGFSDAVGEILVSNPAAKDRSPKFKFYI